MAIAEIEYIGQDGSGGRRILPPVSCIERDMHISHFSSWKDSGLVGPSQSIPLGGVPSRPLTKPEQITERYRSQACRGAGPLESRRVWHRVAQAIEKAEWHTAIREKNKLEEEQ